MNMHAPQKEKMKVWFTAQEIADAAAAGVFPEIPTDKRNVDRMIARENWSRYHALVRTEKGRGGTITRYHIDLLPLPTRHCYFTKYIKVDATAIDQPLPSGENLTNRARQERDARILLLRLADQYQTAGVTVLVATSMFADAYNLGRIEVEQWVRDTVPSLSARTIMRWRAKNKAVGVDALAHDKAMARKNTGLLDTANGGDVRMFILAWLSQNEALAAEEIRDYVEQEYGSELVDANGVLQQLPPLRTFQHFIKKLKEEKNVVLTKILNPDKYRSTIKIRGTGSYSWIKQVGQLWMIDASPADALCLDGRHSIYVAIDLYSRDLVITVSKTPRASAVGLMMRKAILRWGVCQSVKTDNGSDFVAEETKRLFRALNIEALCSPKFTPEVKAHVERAIKTVQHKFFSQLEGYIGHNVAERKAIEGRKSFAARLGEGDIETFSVSMTAEELQAKLDDWLEFRYRHRQHEGIGKKTPAEMIANSRTEIRRVDERALDILLMPVAGKDGIRKMTPQGISIGNDFYFTGSIMPGTEVFVRLHPEDMSKVLAFSPEDGRYLATAICPKFANINRAEFVRLEKQRFNDTVSSEERDVRKRARAIVKSKSGIDRTIALYRGKAEKKAAETANVIPLPKREETHTTADIKAALDAVTSMTPHDPAAPRQLDEETQRIHDEIRMQEAVQVEFSRKRVEAPRGTTALHPQETPRQRYMRFLEVERRMAEGEEIPAETLVALGSYQTTNEYRTEKGLLEAFGEEAPPVPRR